MMKAHSFHIPVMGIGFTLDSPLKVSQYGIDSVISLVDDILLEKFRKMYCNLHDIPYTEISDKDEDYRAERITSYLNLINDLAEKKFEDLRNATIEKGNGIKEYFGMLPENSILKQEFKNLKEKFPNLQELKNKIKENLSMGSIDVNIMTKIDKDNFKNGEQLPVEFNDAHAALRGYANSNLNSSLILSAGMNPRLYGYIEKFKDFFPNEKGEIKKKIVLKVSDFKSAFIQGKFLAKKGIWVSEYRIESGLNCGGHAFATDGFLLGPILSEFRDKRKELVQSVREIFVQALSARNNEEFNVDLPIKITAQGGVGTSEEHQFLMDHYDVDSVGWGSPFLLVPEATTVDEVTIGKLAKAKEEDLYLSEISPLGVSFNNLKGNTKDLEKLANIENGKPGSKCPKKYLSSSKEFTDKAICTASRQYQRLKIEELDNAELSTEEYKNKFDKIVEKSCICVGLGTSSLLANNLDTKVEGNGVSICPGPNMAYFSKEMSLKEITDHIYGRDTLTSLDRPNMFIKELDIYIDYLTKKLNEISGVVNGKQRKYFTTFVKNLTEGVNYYQNLFVTKENLFTDNKSDILSFLNASNSKLEGLSVEIQKL